MNDASLDKNKDIMQEQDMEEHHRRNEEEASDGPLDEREQEIVKYRKLSPFIPCLRRLWSKV